MAPSEGETTPATAAAPASFTIPPGCADNFSGLWVHSDDDSYTYQAEDDGGTLVLSAYRAWPLDGGALDAGAPALAAQVLLRRTAQGFKGTTQAQAVHPLGGRTCPVTFATEVTHCDDGGLTLRSATLTSLGEACQPDPSTVSPIMLEHRLARADAGEL
ncbi:MAG: hypothetical protein K1X64_20795 [Myxococcaceae bacterium]|nr:hypothetical protein [Myxococcaceae bacterium]